MGKRQNYGFQKRQKELEKQKKKDAKAEKKRARREDSGEQSASMDDDADDESDGPTGSSDPAEPSEPTGPSDPAARLDPALRERLRLVCEEGADLFDRFDREVRQQGFHPFVAADYTVVLAALLPLRGPGLRFLEWGSATGVITIMADLLGFEAYGIELDRDLVEQARQLAARTGSGATFVAGSFLPTGYRFRNGGGDGRLGTIGEGESGYLALGLPLEAFDVVFGYPWAGEEPVMLDLMRAYGRADAQLLVHDGTVGVRRYRGGRLVV